MTLTFDNGHFLLLRKDRAPEIIDFAKAGRFKEFADPKARIIFSKYFVKFYDLPTIPLPSFLDPHQVDGVKWALTRSRSYLAHAPGAGKTAQAIVASLLIDRSAGQVVFIVPPDLTKNWELEIIKFSEWTGIFPTVSIVPESGAQDMIAWRSEFLIVPDSMLCKPWVLRQLSVMKKRLVGVDESSRYKEDTSKRAIALFGGKDKDFSSLGLVSDTKHFVLLDGSPMPNGRHMELWAPTYAVCPEAIDFMSKVDFGFKYCGAKLNDMHRWEFKHSTNHEELKARLTKSFMHVVSESELSHPERLRRIVWMNEDPRSPKMIDWERKNLGLINFSDLNEDLSQGQIAEHRQKLGVAKVPWIGKYVTRILEDKKESLLLFAWHREVCEGLCDLLRKFNPGLIIGGTKADEREKIKDQFQNGKRRLIVGNIAALGRGHNLQKADRAVFGEYSWSDETNKQCEKRASRKGRDQAQGVRCDYIAAPSTMDEIVLNTIFGKIKNTERMFG